MNRLLTAAAAALLSSSAMAQTPSTTPAPALPNGVETLGWMHGERVHTNPNGALVYEAFIGPVNGVVTGTALTSIGTARAYTEYHKIGPNTEGAYGLDVMNTANGMKWSFTPLKAIEPGRITFSSPSITIAYFSDGAGGIKSQVDRVGADGKTTTQEWHFKPVPPAK
jgi:hypothetical protein